MAELPKQKWEGKESVKLTSSTADQIWPLWADFCNFHKWSPTAETCSHVEGSAEPGHPGCIRYVTGPRIQSLDGEESSSGVWACEKLLTFDPINRCLSYEITDSNIGFKNYVATIRVLPGDNGSENGCLIEWSYVCDPMEGCKYEDLTFTISATLDTMAQRMQEATQDDTEMTITSSTKIKKVNRPGSF